MKKVRVMRLHSSIEVVYIWTSAKYLYRSLWLSLIIAGYPWLPCYIIWPLMQKIIGNDGLIIASVQTKSHIWIEAKQGKPAGEYFARVVFMQMLKSLDITAFTGNTNRKHQFL